MMYEIVVIQSLVLFISCLGLLQEGINYLKDRPTIIRVRRHFSILGLIFLFLLWFIFPAETLSIPKADHTGIALFRIPLALLIFISAGLFYWAWHKSRYTYFLINIGSSDGGIEVAKEKLIEAIEKNNYNYSFNKYEEKTKSIEIVLEQPKMVIQIGKSRAFPGHSEDEYPIWLKAKPIDRDAKKRKKYKRLLSLINKELERVKIEPNREKAFVYIGAPIVAGILPFFMMW